MEEVGEDLGSSFSSWSLKTGLRPLLLFICLLFSAPIKQAINWNPGTANITLYRYFEYLLETYCESGTMLGPQQST